MKANTENFPTHSEIVDLIQIWSERLPLKKSSVDIINKSATYLATIILNRLK